MPVAAYTDWPDGKRHSIPYAQHLANMRAAAGNPLTLPKPPAGTYDPSLDYNSQAANRGLLQTTNDAQTQFEQGQQDYGLGLGDLNAGRDRLYENFNTQTADLGHQYSILGHQQAQAAAQHGITSAGLLGKSAAIRSANQTHDQGALNVDLKRGLEDIGRQRTTLDLTNARTFGGFNGQTILNPLTGQPEVGSLLTGVQRATTENSAYQTGLLGQMASQAQANGYISPLLSPNGAKYGYAGSTPLNAQQYNAGIGLESLLRNGARQNGMTYEAFARQQGIDPVTLKRIGPGFS